MTSEQDLIYLEPLTHREKEILQLLASGSSNHEIATKLFLEVSTVKWHNAQIYDKLRVKNRKEAIIRAQTLGILEANSSKIFLQILHNLPADTLPFIGRAEEIQALVKQLNSDKYRLITILGPGGMGKTRLAIEVGRYLIAHFIDGVYFVPLAAVTTAEQIITTIAAIVGFKFHNGEQIHKQLFEHLQQQQLLLIIDNFEHLLASGDLLTDILHHAPRIRILVTSREKLNVIGETIHFLNGLAVPVDERLESITRSDAVRLFMETAHRTGAIVSAKEMVIVSRICQLLGGMPLGILLAAAWTDTLSLAEIQTELIAGLSILEADLRDVPARHHSIEAVFDYSWRRLTADEQNGFMYLSVFRGGFTREAAQRITGISLHNLQRLVHTSFIQHQPSGRYTLHELLRQYGEQQLTVSGNYDKLRENHALYFADFMTPLGSVGWEQATPDMLETVKADFENVRTAWIFQAERKNINELRRFLDGVWLFLDLYSRSQEGVELFELLLPLTVSQNDDDIELFRGQVLARLGWFYNDIGRVKEAVAFAEEAHGIVQKYDCPNDTLLLYLSLAVFMQFSQRIDEFHQWIDKGYELCLKTPGTKWSGLFTFYKGAIYFDAGDYQKTLEWLHQHPSDEMMGQVLTRLGKYDEAEQYLLKTVKDKPQFHRFTITHSYCCLIENAVLARNYERAWNYTQRALQYVNDSTYAWLALKILGYVVPLLIGINHSLQAAEILALVMSHPAAMESTRATVVTYQDTLKKKILSEAFGAAWERGQQLDLGDVITEYMER
jgi:predicted ATPase/DNA-binding CsgD family transcriptional regulator